MLVSSGPWWSCAALLVVFIHLLSSFFLQWTHHHVQRLCSAGMGVYNGYSWFKLQFSLKFPLLFIKKHQWWAIYKANSCLWSPYKHAHRLPLQMQRPAEASDRDKYSLRYLVLRSGRIILWWCLAEFMIHVMYMHSIQSTETYLEILPPWALGKCLSVCNFVLCYIV